jgi:hypothetical protein
VKRFFSGADKKSCGESWIFSARGRKIEVYGEMNRLISLFSVDSAFPPSLGVVGFRGSRCRKLDFFSGLAGCEHEKS